MSIYKIGKRILPKKLRRAIVPFYRFLNNYYHHGTSEFFSAIEIETLTKCNRKCYYCPNAKYDRGEHANYMSTELYHKIIDELALLNYNGRVSPHFYGEPLLDERMYDLMKYTRKKLPGAYIVIYTNGDFLTKQVFDKLTADGVVDSFLITQHIGVISQVLKDTMEAISEIDKRKITLRVFKKDDSFSNRGGLVDVKNTEVMRTCDFPANAVIVDYSGNVVLCCNDYFSTIKFGSLVNERLIDIWKKKKYKKLRHDLKKGIFSLEICKKCVN